MKERNYKLPYYLVEILLYLLKENTIKTSTEIFEHVRESLKHVLPSENTESDKKIFLRALNILENLGILESKPGKGRKPSLWKVKGKIFKERNFFLLESDLYFYLIFFSFIPNEYKELPLFKPVLKVIEYFSEGLKPEKLKIIGDAFAYEPPFAMRFARPDTELLKEVVKAIVDERPLRIIKDGKERTILPLNLFFYSGNLYLGAIKIIKENSKYKFPYRSYLLHSIKLSPSGSYVKTEVKIPRSIIDENRRKHIGFPDEKPFIFGIELDDLSAKEIKKGGKVFSTQFFTEPNQNVVYLVGFTSSRFYNDFIIKGFKKIIPPNKEIIDVAKEKKVKELVSEIYPHLPKVSYGLTENIRNFKRFRREIKALLMQKLNIL